jgi:hypothetical protein
MPRSGRVSGVLLRAQMVNLLPDLRQEVRDARIYSAYAN